MVMISEWYNEEKTIYHIYLTSEGIKDWQEYRQAMDAAIQVVRTVHHPVIAYFDPGFVAMPPGNPFPHLRYVIRKMPPNVFAVVNVVNSQFVRAILSWFINMGFYQSFYLVSSNDEAEALIEQLQAANENVPELGQL